MKKLEQRVPNLRFKGFTNDWEQRKLGDEYKHIGNAFVGTASPYYTQNGYFYLESNNIKNGQINHDHEVFINESFYHKQLNKLLHTGDLVMVQSGHVGDTAVITEKYNGTAAHALIMFRKPKNNMLSFFLNSFFQSSNAKNRIDVLAIGNTIRHILASDMKKFVVYLPDNKEKGEVAELFLELQKLIALQQRKLELLKQLKKGLLQKMFADKDSKQPVLRFKGFHDDWEQHKLGEVCEKTYSGLTGKNKQDFGHGKAKYITYLNVHDNAIATTKGVDQVEIDPKQNEVVKGDLLFTVSSEVPEEVALNSVWPGTDNNVYLNSFCFGMRPMSKSVNSFFLTYYLRSPQMRRNIYPLAQGISRFNISKRGILSLTINLPNIREQINVYKVIKNIECLVTLQHQKLAKYQSIKKSLLQQMFI